MPTWLLAFPWAKALSYVAAIALGAWLSFLMYAEPHIADEKLKTASVQAELDRVNEADVQATADFIKAAQAKQQELQNAADQAEAKYVALQAADAKRIAALAADAGQLRSTIAAYAAGTGPYALKLPSPGAPGGGPDARAELLGQLLADCNDVLVQGAAAASRGANQIRGLEAVAPPAP